MYSPQLVVELSRLLMMEVDAARAYANAVALLGPGPIRDELTLIGHGHQEHADAIRGEIAFRGYVAPDPTSSVEGYVLGSSGPPDAPPGPEEALGAVHRNEQLAGSLYAKLLARGPPEGAVPLLERHRAEAERHRGWAERQLRRLSPSGDRRRGRGPPTR